MAVLLAASCLAAVDGRAAVTAQPGMEIAVDANHCTLGFILVEPTTHDRYATTAGHCVPGMDERAPHDRVWDAGDGPDVVDRVGRRLGRLVFAALADDADLAIIRLEAEVRAVPRVCGWHAPRTLDSSRVSMGDEARFHGQGAVVGTATPSRTGIVSGATSRHSFALVMVGAPGDSGGPVLVGDAAAGILVAADIGLQSDPGLLEAVRLDVMLERPAVAGLSLELLSPGPDDVSRDAC